jgi:aryl-alcohol dehydrogenase-like predicted oxidoreductase
MDKREVQNRLDAVQRIQASEVPAGTPMAAWALAWCLRQPAVDAVVTGVKTVDQLESSAVAVEPAGR